MSNIELKFTLPYEFSVFAQLDACQKTDSGAFVILLVIIKNLIKNLEG